MPRLSKGGESEGESGSGGPWRMMYWHCMISKARPLVGERHYQQSRQRCR